MATEQESANRVDSGEEKSPAAPAGNRTRNLSMTNPALYQQAVLATQKDHNVTIKLRRGRFEEFKNSPFTQCLCTASVRESNLDSASQGPDLVSI